MWHASHTTFSRLRSWQMCPMSRVSLLARRSPQTGAPPAWATTTRRRPRRRRSIVCDQQGRRRRQDQLRPRQLRRRDDRARKCDWDCTQPPMPPCILAQLRTAWQHGCCSGHQIRRPCGAAPGGPNTAVQVDRKTPSNRSAGRCAGLTFNEIVAELRARARKGVGHSSHFRGVSLLRATGRWHAQINAAGNQVMLRCGPTAYSLNSRSCTISWCLQCRVCCPPQHGRSSCRHACTVEHLQRQP